MRAIEEYNVTGTFSDEPVNGKVTAYKNNLSKAIPQGLKTAVITTWEQAKKTTNLAVNNVISYTKNHPELNKKLVTGALVLVMAASFTGCSLSPNASVKSETNIEQSIGITEATGEVKYVVQAGDTLEGIVSTYLQTGISAEVNKVCRENQISDANRIYVGQKLTLDVPISKLENFGYTYTYGEVSDWQSMEHFVYSAFDIPAEDIHPQNFMFWRDKHYAVGVSGGDMPENIADMVELEGTPLLIKAASAIYDYEIMSGDQAGFYSEEDLIRKEAEINSYYIDAIEIAERVTGKKYGVDFILEPPVVAVPMQKTLK